MKKETFTELPKVFKTMISKVIVDGKEYKNIVEWYNSLDNKEGEFNVLFNSITSKLVKIQVSESALKDSPFFKFNEIYNNNKPIPMTIMQGIKLEEEDNKVKMDLWDSEHKINWVGWILKSWILRVTNV